jgi:hypothetical protein
MWESGQASTRLSMRHAGGARARGGQVGEVLCQLIDSSKERLTRRDEIPQSAEDRIYQLFLAALIWSK